MQRFIAILGIMAGCANAQLLFGDFNDFKQSHSQKPVEVQYSKIEKSFIYSPLIIHVFVKNKGGRTSTEV